MDLVSRASRLQDARELEEPPLPSLLLILEW